MSIRPQNFIQKRHGLDKFSAPKAAPAILSPEIPRPPPPSQEIPKTEEIKDVIVEEDKNSISTLSDRQIIAAIDDDKPKEK
jgi:hypothetical protein